jgi:hypothetical protein
VFSEVCIANGLANGSAPDSSTTNVTIDTSRTVGVVFGLLNPYETTACP